MKQQNDYDYVQLPEPKGFGKILAIALCVAALFAYALFGCKTPAKMLRKHDKVQDKCIGMKLDTVGAHWCKVNYPVEAKTVVKNTYINGKTDTVVWHDTSVVVTKDTVYKNITVTKFHNTVDTFVIDTSKTIIDSRSVTLLQAQYTGAMDEASKYKQKYETAQSKVNKRTWLAIGGIGLFVALFALVLYAKFRM